MGTKDSKPPKRQGPVGGMVPQKPKPPLTGGNSQGGPGGSWMRGSRPKPTGGGGTASNSKPTP